MISRPGFILALVLAAPRPAAAAVEHPVMDAIIARAAGGLRGPCLSALMPELSRIASVETSEVNFVLKDMRDGTCRVVLIGRGSETSVGTDPAVLDRELSDPLARRVSALHTHPLGNSAYFGSGTPYGGGEIMFADEAAIAARRLPEAVYQETLRGVREGRLPGFNLSPPSMQDLLAAVDDGRFNREDPGRVVSIVLTSGGYWTHSVVDRAAAIAGIDSLVPYAGIFEAATRPPRPGDDPRRRERARRLLAAIMADEPLRQTLERWAETGIGLRAPHSQDALARHAAGDPAGVELEFAEKLAQSARFAELLKAMGIAARFTPFSRE